MTPPPPPPPPPLHRALTHLVGCEEQAFEVAAEGALRAANVKESWRVGGLEARVGGALVSRMPDVEDAGAGLLPEAQLQAVGIF